MLIYPSSSASERADPDPRRAYKNDLPGSRRAPCLGCGKPVVTARHAHVPIGGRRDGSLLIEIDMEPLVSNSNDPDALFDADDLYLLGVAHRDCIVEARRRLIALDVELPEDLPRLLVDDDVAGLPLLHRPPTLDQCPFCGRRGLTSAISRSCSQLGPLK